MATFTSWADLHKTMLNDMASGNWRVSSYSVDGRDMNYRAFDEFRSALEYVERRAAEEAGRAFAQVEAVPRRGGRW